MFKKVLIAEDMDSINLAVAASLKEIGIENIAHAQYCDQAWLMTKKAIQDKEPFDLLICDLSFKKDHRNEKILSGKELINILRSEDPDLKIIVNSIEDHPQTLRELWDTGNIDAYVCKDRQGLKYLKEAVETVATGKTYNSPNIDKILQRNNLLVLNEFEVNILNLLAEGKTQDEIQEELRKKDIKPSSKSAIEKKLKEMKEVFQAKTTIHLISIAKDLKLI
ncbi:DNA-binding response regulator [Christiangramia fulva]|uniref:DNA-binding response regulator n=1 Tax=Christiangramia fulva TaxID=2126553 RepID=A0A2R3ZA41_9FLAO|nr:response regulator [Christiangramia fulva]AVR47074.1 DNA-binding response regulator [Christiangramia fulva]